MRMMEQVKSYWLSKIRGEAVPKSAVMKGLAQVGGVFAAQGRPQLEDRNNDELMNPAALDKRNENFPVNGLLNRTPTGIVEPGNS